MNTHDSDDLYNVPIEQLGLSANATEILARVGILTVGDCINMLNLRGMATVSWSPDMTHAVFSEVERQLKEHGYLRSDTDASDTMN